MRLSKYHGKQNVIHVEETSPENVPFTFENRCSELVFKVKQYGEKQVRWIDYPFMPLYHSTLSQCWLVNPSMSLHYTWDNCVRTNPQAQWTVYGSNDEPFQLKISPGKVGIMFYI